MVNVGANTFKVLAAGATAAAAGVMAIGTAAVKGYADFEQLVGGVETLFGTNGAKSMQEYADYIGKSVDEIKDEYEMLTEAQNLCMSNARKAYKDAGLSMNEYMETVSSFAASLKQSVEDEVEAAEAADQAVIDMADNANKMGTSMESIQNAYQGFAKQNYTMLDNLKLGYGGTKTEMERLLSDAEKLHEKTTGEVTHYSMDNLSDVFSAIHDVQVELGITGTTAKEAATTISGSMNMAKAAWSNLLVGVADDSADFDSLVADLVESVSVVAENIVPRVEVALGGIGELITQLVPMVVQRIPELLEGVVPDLLQSGVNMVTAVVSGMQSNLPQIMASVVNIVIFLISSFAEMLPQLLEMGVQLISELALGIGSAIPTLLATVMEILPQIIEGLLSGVDDLVNTGFELLSGLIEGFVDAIPDALPKILEFVQEFADGLAQKAPELIAKGFELLSMLVDGIIQAIPILIENVPTIVSTFANIINDNFPMILLKGVELIGQLIMGILEAIPTLIENIPQIVTAIVDVIEAFDWLNLGKDIMKFFKDGIKGMVGKVKEAGKEIFEAVKEKIKDLPSELKKIGKDAITDMGDKIAGMSTWITEKAKAIFDAVKGKIGELPESIKSIGKDLVEGLWNGISDKTGWIIGKIQEFGESVLGGIKDFFGIHSPSRKFRWIGEMCVAGFDEGMEDLADTKTLTTNINARVETVQMNSGKVRVFGGSDGGPDGFNQTVNIYQPVSSPDEMARAMRLEGRYGLIIGVA